jgi:hypothetical protein
MHVVVYLWSFDDGKTAEGQVVAHTYAHTGRYKISLTVINGAGLRSTSYSLVNVTAAARITHVAVQTSRTGAVLLVKVSGPGRLRFGSQRLSVARAGVVRVRLRLTTRELKTLRAGGRLRLRSALAFSPVYGPVCRDVVTVGFRPRASRRFNAVLLRTS